MIPNKLRQRFGRIHRMIPDHVASIQEQVELPDVIKLPGGKTLIEECQAMSAQSILPPYFLKSQKKYTFENKRNTHVFDRFLKTLTVILNDGYKMKISFRNAWVKATTFGFLSFLLMIPISFIFTALFHPLYSEGVSLPEIFNQSRDKSPMEYGWEFFMASQLGHFILYVIVGTTLSHFQYKVLKEYIPNKLMWTILTILGLELVLLGDLFYAGLSTGGVPGPLEPLLIGLGGGGLMALMQFLYLRSRGITSAKWVGWWILGIVTGILSSIIFIFTYEYFLIDNIKQAVSPMTFLVIDWLSFILPYFTLIGFFAGLFSAKPLYRSLQPADIKNNN